MTDPATPAPVCPECGTRLPEDSPGALCPTCLMRQALASRTVPDPDADAPPPAPPPPPEEIAGHFPQFEITECLGRGGMGVVYKARQKSLDRWVAIKILAPERVGEERFAERFAREAQMLASLSHPNIVTVFDYGETGGLYYIVMEFVDGVNLRDLLREGKLEPRQALTIVPPVCEALQYAHDKGIVHRDIKPENLLLDRDGRIKIADFGIAALVGARGEASGTPPYMAPEQKCSANETDHRADIYALGAVLYEALTGERPDTPLHPPSQKVQVDIRIDDIVLRALSQEPERRYRSADEFRTMVETVVSTPTPPPPPAGPVPPNAAPPNAAPPNAAPPPFPASKLSGMAVTGAVFQALFVGFLLLGVVLISIASFLAPPPIPISSGQTGTVNVARGGANITVLLVMLPFLFFSIPGGILGWIAAARIRASEGELRGMGFAVFAAMPPVVLLVSGLLLALGAMALRTLLVMILRACIRHLIGAPARRKRLPEISK